MVILYGKSGAEGRRDCGKSIAGFFEYLHNVLPDISSRKLRENFRTQFPLADFSLLTAVRRHIAELLFGFGLFPAGFESEGRKSCLYAWGSVAGFTAFLWRTDRSTQNLFRGF